ncbi:MAG: hypothetical protein K2P63_14385 [Lachnospiraceae bacterium]|nr:hypothetical protein [Lachnospiraceae bacterium]
MRKMTGVLAFIVCIPMVGTILVKPEKDDWGRDENDTSVMDESFVICVEEDTGTYYYRPERMTELSLYRIIPEDTIFSSSQDYIVLEDTVYDPEQEYLKALSVVCRTNIAAAWEQQQRPAQLDYSQIAFGADAFYKILRDDVGGAGRPADDSMQIKLNEIKQAVDATKGAVITRDGRVITAPFFTTTPSDMLVGRAGDGAGFSLNYAYDLALGGMNFYEILMYFYDDIRVMIYE